MNSFLFLQVLTCFLRSGIFIRQLKRCIRIKNFSFICSFQTKLNVLTMYLPAANVMLSKSHCLVSLLLSRETPLILPSGCSYGEEDLFELQYQ